MNYRMGAVSWFLVVFVASGLGCSEDDDEELEYDGPYCDVIPWQCDQFEAGPVLSDRREHHEVVALDEERVLLVGGTERVEGEPPYESRMLERAEIVDVAAGQTRDGGELSQPRTGHAVRAPDGAVLLIGGRDGEWEELRSVERFDPDTESWSVLGGQETSFQPHVAEVGDASLLLVGGSDSDGDPVFTAQRYDADTDVLQEASSPDHAYRFPELVSLDDGRVLVLEGENEGEFDEETGRIYGEVYDPSDVWSPVESLQLNTRVDRLSAAELPDGQILVLFSHRELDDEMETPINATSWAWLNQLSAVLYDLEDDEWTELGTFDQIAGGLRPDITWLPGIEKYLLHLLGDSEDWTYGYLFDPQDKEWEFLYERRPIPGWAIEVLPGDQVLFRYSERLEIYDATTNSWSEFDVIPETLRFSSMKLLPDCRLFFSGARVVGGDPMDEPEMHTAFCTPE